MMFFGNSDLLEPDDMFPSVSIRFRFRNIWNLKAVYTGKDIHAELADYIRLGGFPATHLREYSQDEVYTIVRDIYNSTIFRIS